MPRHNSGNTTELLGAGRLTSASRSSHRGRRGLSGEASIRDFRHARNFNRRAQTCQLSVALSGQ